VQDAQALKKCFRDTSVAGCDVVSKDKRLPDPAPILSVISATIAIENVDPALLMANEAEIADAIAQELGLPNPNKLSVEVVDSGSRRRRDVCDTGVLIVITIIDVPEPLLPLLTIILTAAVDDGSLVPGILAAVSLPETTVVVIGACAPFRVRKYKPEVVSRCSSLLLLTL
jgi:hypothetical protein